MEMENLPNPTLAIVKRAHSAFRQLTTASGAARRQGILAMARSIQHSFDAILEANTLDLEMSREMAIQELMIDWLKLTPERLEITVKILKQLAKTADPTKKLINSPYQLEPSQTYCQLMPLGVIALVYEAFPELAAIAAGMCLKTGNSLILRGCSSASNSNLVLGRILQEALEEAKLPIGSLEVISSDQRVAIQDLVSQNQYLNLIIPYGRPSLIQQVTQQATVPILRAAMGNCYLYWSSSGDLELVRQIVLDSHKSEPDPVNAIEKVLIQADKKSSSLVSLFNSLQEEGFKLRGEAQLVKEFPEFLKPVNPTEWIQPYLNKIIAFKLVDSLSEAIDWINRYSSGHADCLVTESYLESRQFAREVDSALVYINASPRFSRNPNSGEAVFLGMSNQKGYRRGFISLESFTTVKQIVQGEGC
jgi:glutamate-5-semialdehyde dehydrogenase